MPTIDERVAYLEGKVEEHSHGFAELREMVIHLDQKIDRRLDAVDRRFEALDLRFERLEQRLDQRIDGVAQKVEALDAKIGLGLMRLDDKMSRQFLWILGVQVAVLIAVVGALAGG